MAQGWHGKQCRGTPCSGPPCVSRSGPTVVCPWCYIGKRRLEKAIAGFEHGDDVEVVYRSYELDPFAPEVGTESTVTVLGRKFGADEAGTRAMMARADEVAAAEGLTFAHADALHARTLTAHRLLHLAKAEGRQHELLEQVLAAYFTRGESLGDHDVLRRAAAEAGLDPARVEEVLSSDEFRDDVMADVAQARAYRLLRRALLRHRRAVRDLRRAADRAVRAGARAGLVVPHGLTAAVRRGGRAATVTRRPAPVQLLWLPVRDASSGAAASGQQQDDRLRDAGGLVLALDLDRVLHGELQAAGDARRPRPSSRAAGSACRPRSGFGKRTLLRP